LDTLKSRIRVGESEMIRIMARKYYSDEFRRQAVDLYESSSGATVRGIAEDLGIERGTLRHWLDLYGSGKKTAADGSSSRSRIKSCGAGASSGPSGGAGAASEQEETPEAAITRLEAEVAALRQEQVKLVTEREILRQAAKSPGRRAP
jgi:transposase